MGDNFSTLITLGDNFQLSVAKATLDLKGESENLGILFQALLWEPVSIFRRKETLELSLNKAQSLNKLFSYLSWLFCIKS